MDNTHFHAPQSMDHLKTSSNLEISNILNESKAKENISLKEIQRLQEIISEKENEAFDLQNVLKTYKEEISELRKIIEEERQEHLLEVKRA